MKREESEVIIISKKKTDFDQNAYIVGYMKTHYKRLQILLHLEDDADIITWLDSQPDKTKYLKRLIREDMKK